MKSGPGDATRLVSLTEAARLVNLDPEIFWELAKATADWEPGHRTSIFHTPSGPMFDPIECEGLGHILDGIFDELNL